MKKSKLNIILAVFLIVGMLLALSGATGAAGKLSFAVNSFLGLSPMSLAGPGNGIFGNDIVGSVTDHNVAGTQLVSYFVCNQVVGVITDIGAYIQDPTTGYAQAALYGDDGSLITTSNIVAVGSSYSWVDFPLQYPYDVASHGAGHTYGLAIMSDSYINYMAVPSGVEYYSHPGSFGNGFSDPFGSTASTSYEQMSIYASSLSSATPTPTFNPTSTPTPTPMPTASPSSTPIPQVSLTMGISGQGTINPSSGTTNYNINTQVSISATASSGYTFSYWVFGDSSKSYSASTTLTMSTSQSALAVFVQNAQPTPTPIPQVTLTMGVSGQGSITPTAGSSNYNVGSQVTISATPSNGYTFSYWLFNDGTQNSASSVTLTMSQSRSALAVFAATPTVTPTPAPGATPAPTPVPTAQPTPLPTSTAQPTTQPTITPEPTPLPINGATPTPTPIEIDTSYGTVNELFTTLGLSVIAVDVLGFALNNGLLGKKR